MKYEEIEIIIHAGVRDLTKFDCGNEDLNEFLRDDSLKQQNAMLNITYLVIYREEIIGYFTLSTDNIKLSNLKKEYKEKFNNKDVYYKVFPAAK